MAPGNTADEVRTLRERVVQLEHELVLHKLNAGGVAKTASGS